MKFLQLAFIIILISACLGTKCIAENSQQKVSVLKDDKNETNIFSKSLEDSITKEIILPKPHFYDRWNNLLQSYVSKNGKVNYKGFKSNWKDLRSYIESLGENTPNKTSSKEEQLAYWINAYNAMTIDLILQNYPLTSIKEIDNPWGQSLWKLGTKWYNLNEIEHKILRKMDEPRIHFAIVCASYSCPKLQNKPFTSEDIDNQLTNVTKAFLNDPERNSISENNLELSKIFQWFAKDFKQNGSLIDFLNQYSDIKISDKAKKSFKDYNWALNE